MAKRQRDKIIRISYGATLASLAVVLLMVGGALEMLDMTSSMVASLVILVSAVQFGVGHSLIVYAVSSCLSLIFMPTASSVWYFVLVLGYFPSLCEYLSQKVKKGWLRYAVKLVAFNVAVTVTLALFAKLYGFAQIIAEFSLFGEPTTVTFALIYILLNVFLAAYNLFLSRAKFLYRAIFRKKPKAKKNF